MKIKNQVICDLRPYNSPEAMQKISRITNTVLLLVPKEMDDRTKAAYATIEKQNIVSEVAVDSTLQPVVYNGNCTLNNTMIPDRESFLILNGNCRIESLSREKSVKIIANGNLLYDVRSEAQIEILQSNGTCFAVNLDKLIEIPDCGTLTEAVLSDDPETTYLCSGAMMIVPRLAQQAVGTVIAPIVVADSSVRDTRLALKSGMIFYRDQVTESTEVKKQMNKLRISADFLKQLSGKLVIFNTRHVLIDKSVTPELLREKVLLFFNIHHLKATRQTLDTVQLLAENVKILTK